ncbi:MAG: hypothetical protein WBD74_03400 [Candidatus Aquilonibacter sp.]
MFKRMFTFAAVAVVLVGGLTARPIHAQTEPTSSPEPIAGAPQGVTATVFVPKGEVVAIATTEALSSYAASPREPITYTVLQDVVVNGFLVAKAGDEVDGEVLEAQQGKAGFDGIGYKAADLRISAESVHNYCGDTIKMHFVRTEYRRRQGAFGSKADVEIVDGQKYVAVTAFPQKVCGQATTEVQAALPADALLGDKD